LINAEHGVFARSLNNVESITGNIAKNNEKFNDMIDNFDKTSQKLAKADLDKLISSLASTTNKLDATIGKLNSKDGTAGLLLNDRQLYDEIRQTNRSLTILLDDLRVNPKRYVSISVFGKKQKQQPLMTPIYDSTGKR
jgi:phospholipid/cholesterol/gamma-HCH transport system substrate-binding protein